MLSWKEARKCAETHSFPTATLPDLSQISSRGCRGGSALALLPVWESREGRRRPCTVIPGRGRGPGWQRNRAVAAVVHHVYPHRSWATSGLGDSPGKQGVLDPCSERPDPPSGVDYIVTEVLPDCPFLKGPDYSSPMKGPRIAAVLVSSSSRGSQGHRAWTRRPSSSNAQHPHSQ